MLLVLFKPHGELSAGLWQATGDFACITWFDVTAFILNGYFTGYFEHIVLIKYLNNPLVLV